MKLCSELILKFKELQNSTESKIIYHPADITKPSEIAELVKYAESEIGKPIDILVNNAGIQFTAPIEQFPIDKFNEVMQVNLVSNFYTIRETIGKMKQKNWGRIINISRTGIKN